MENPSRDFDVNSGLFRRIGCIIAEKGFVENGIKEAMIKMVDVPFYSALMEKELEEDEGGNHNWLAFLYWHNNDKDHMLKMSKQLPYQFPKPSGVYYLGYYKDGSGYIVYIDNEDLVVSYYAVSDEIRKHLADMIDKKLDWIVEHPVSLAADDRCFFNAHLHYNLMHKYPHPEQFLKDKWESLETTDYSDDELEFPIAKVLLDAPEVKRIWMKLHQQAGI